ncbi:MAG: HD domain-containing protein [Rickettsiales bacterium]|jgi:uncharacterized protein|nr:HD domain-containing protein [Rickettsiales bacterium]
MTDKLQEFYKLVEDQGKTWDRHENAFPGQTWKYHLKPVIDNAVRFALARGGDVHVVEIAALFHDYAGLVDFEKYEAIHHIASGDLAEPLLRDAGYSQEFIDKVKKCIFAHRGRVLKEKKSVEEECVADADAVAHIENVFQIIMWMGQSGRSIEDGNEFVKGKITRDFVKLSDAGKDYIRDKYEAILKILY